MSKVQPIEQPLEVGEILRIRNPRDHEFGARYRIKDIRVGYWGDGATGYQLCRYWGGGDVGIKFWVRPEELCTIYRRFNDRPMP